MHIKLIDGIEMKEKVKLLSELKLIILTGN